MARPKRYKLGYPGVTSVIGILDKPFLIPWHRKIWKILVADMFKKMNMSLPMKEIIEGINPFVECDRIKKESQDIGHDVHGALENWLKGATFEEVTKDLSLNEIGMLTKFVNGCKKHGFKPKPEDLERTVYCHDRKFAGTLDAKIIGLIADWKTDRTPTDEAQEREVRFKYGLQNAGYAIAVEEEDGEEINRAVTIRVSKDQEYAEYWFEDLTEYKRLFLNLREIYFNVRGK